jgi:predicted DNA-binding transcriptional regulator AlpA
MQHQKTPETPLQYVSDNFLAKRYNVARQTIWRWVREGTFPPPVKLSPGCSRWSMASVEESERSKAVA